tara:strand:+ start:500 stop:949 length:450 start_codon:yes stop_codon:yes gene_type:complete
MQIRIYDNYFTEKECKELIDLYDKYKYLAVPFYNVIPLKVKKLLPKKFINKINKTSKAINKSKIDWIEVVKWPIGAYKDLHYDCDKNTTLLSSIVFLNDDYEGGHFYFEDNSVIRPKTGRALFFDGNYYQHGVSKVDKKIRWQLTAFYE